MKEVLYNSKITAQNVRIIHNSEDLGIMPTSEAIKLAKEQGLDVVVVSMANNVTVAKFLDYKKYMYDLNRKEKLQKKMSKTIETKTIQLRYCIDTHDLSTKLKRAGEFLEEGNKVLFLMKFKRKEIIHMKEGQDLINRIIDLLGASIDKPMQVTEKNISITLRK